LKKESAKELKPVYIIFGEEKLLLEEALERLKKKLVGEVDLTLSYDEFRGSEANVDSILGAANTMPFLGSKRLIVVKEADKLTVSDGLVDYIENPSEFTYFILMADKIDKRSRLYKGASKKGYVYEYKSPKGRELPKWVKEKFSKRGIKISDDAVQYICLNVDNDLMRLQGEIDKICLYHQDKKSLGLDDTKPLIKKSAESSIFELVDLIGRHKKEMAFNVLNNLVESGEPVTYLFHMMLRQFRLLLKTKVLMEERRVSYSKLMEELKLPPFVVNGYHEQSRNFTIGQLKRAHELCLEAEISLKTTNKDPNLILEMLIAKIIP